MLIPLSNPIIQGAITGFTSAQVFRYIEPATGLPLVYGHGAAGLAVLAMFGLSDGVSFIISYFVTLATSILIYRYYFHPLRNYPGPKAARITQFWLTRLSYTGKRHEVIRKLHDQYGDLVRIGPNQLSVASHKAVIPILGPNGWDKGPYYDCTMKPAGSTSLFSLCTIATHSQRRKVWDHAFSPKALQNYQPILSSRVTQLVETLEDHEDQSIFLDNYLSYFTFDFMGDLAFGGGFDMMRTGDPKNYWEALQSGMMHTYGLGTVPWLCLDSRKVMPLPQNQQEFIGFSTECFMNRRAKGSGMVDVFSWLLGEHPEQPLKLSDLDLAADSTLVLGAGVDTSVTAMAYLFAYLLSPEYKHHYDRLMKELSEFIEEDVNFLTDVEKLGNAPFLNAVIYEGLRLGSPVPSGSQRISPANGAFIEGNYIPGGCYATVHTWSIHRDGRIYDQPDVFNPERFVGKTPQPEAFLPFSYGPFSCVGKRLAFMEIRQIVANILFNYEFELDPAFNLKAFEQASSDHFMMKAGKVPVTIKKRKW